MFLKRLQYLTPVFVLTVAYSKTVQLAGLSGAGTTPELRELTASADAEILAHGKALCLEGGVPSNPTGAPGPSIITRAAFDLLPAMPYICLDAGLKIPANVPGLRSLAGGGPAEAVSGGQALGKDTTRARQLFESGRQLGRELGQQYAQNGYLILAESVPGGTTTALGVLLGLGINAEERVSSSMPGNAHILKLAAVEAGLQAAHATKGSFAANPLGAAAALGDPMQPAVAGLALAASQFCPVVLAGGTQMAAVLALAAASQESADFSQIGLATTRWVAADPTADLPGLLREIEQRYNFSASYFAANLNFSGSKYPAMQLYEQGYVKEGVGAGAAALAAMLHRQLSNQEFLPYIEAVYEKLVLML